MKKLILLLMLIPLLLYGGGTGIQAVYSYSPTSIDTSGYTGSYVILYPDGDAINAGIGVPENTIGLIYTNVDGVVCGEDYYLGAKSTNQQLQWFKALFTHEDTALSGTISSVVLAYSINAGQTGMTQGGYNPTVKIGDTEYTGGAVYLDDEALTGSYSWETSPATSSAWTWDEVNGLIAGLSVYSGYTDTSNSAEIKVYQINVIVYYGASSGWSGNICGTENAENVNGVSVLNIKSINGVE